MRLRRPSPALAIACIALFVAMGGVSYGYATGSIDTRELKDESIRGTDIRNGTITTKDIRNNEVRGADIRNSTIGGRDVAFNTLGGQDIKESTLGQVPDSGKLNGLDATAFVRREAPAFVALTLDTGAPVAGEAAPAYDVDGNGYVHLQGTMSGSGTSTAFTLPAGARPAATSRFVVRDGATGIATLTIAPTGESSLAGATGDVSFDGVSFAAGG